MKKLKKLLLSLACFALGAALTLVGTLAYLQDETDTAYNVMTSGNVKIEQLELERNAGKLVNVTKGKPADPAVYNDDNVSKDVSINWASLGYNGTSDLYANSIGNVVDNFVFIKNTGSNAAYVRTVIAIECPTGLDNDIHVNKNVNGISWSTFYTNIDGVRYMLLVATYVNALAGGATSAPSLLQLYLDPTVMNEDTALFGDTWDVLVISQAVQTTGFQASEDTIADYALDKAFGDVNENNTPWTRENDPQKPEIPAVVDTAAEFKAALANGGSIVLTKDIKVSEIATIPAGVTVELDLNGKTVSADVENTGDFHIIDNKGTLVINDETGKGKIELVDAVVSATAAYATNAIRNSGKLIVNAGTIQNNLGVASYAIDNAPNGVAIVNGGKILNTAGTAIRVYAFSASEVSELVVNGGEIEGTFGIRLQNLSTSVKSAAKVTVNGGVIIGNDPTYKMALYSLCNDGTNFEINILGGTFNGDVAFGGGNKAACETVLVDLACEFNGPNKVFSYIEDAKFGYVVYTAEDFCDFAKDENVNLIVLGANVSIDADDTITVEAGTTKTIDLNGFTLGGISDDADKNDDGKLTSADNEVMIDVRGTLTVKNGKMVYEHKADNFGWNACTELFYVAFNGVLNVENVTMENLGGSDMAYCIDLVNATNVTLNVTDSTLKSSYIPVRVFNNGAGMNNVTIEGTKLEGVSRAFWVHIYSNTDNGGKGIKDATLNLNIYGNGNTFTANDPYRIIEFGFTDEINFDANGNLIVKDTASLQDALKDGDNVTLTDDVTIDLETETSTAPYGNKVAVVHNGGTFDGNGNTVSLNTSAGDHYVIMTNGGTIKNLTVDCGFRGVMIMNPTQDVILNNVISGGDVCYALNTGEGNGTHSIIATKCTFNGWSSIGTAVKDVTFIGCTFGQGEYYTNVYGRLVKPYVTAVFENCDFSSKYYVDLSSLGANQTVTFKNCTVNGVKLTAENWTSLIAPESTCGDGQISIELTNGSYMTAGNVADYVVIQ